jgi:C4-dicarboxylate-specific signal transduction histidine kinase
MLKAALQNPDVKKDQLISMLDSIEKTAGRIEKIMKTVKSLAYGGEGESLQRVSMAALVDSAVDLLGAKIRSRGVQLRVELMGSEQMIECRPTEIFQILVNLVTNAFDAVKGADGAAWIEIRGEVLAAETVGAQKLLRFTVTDSGRGIPVEIQRKLFTPFFTTKEMGVGTGLGLTISQSLAYKNRGRIFYNPNHLHTQFVFEMPVA